MSPSNFRLAVLSLGLVSAFGASAQTTDAQRLQALEQKFNQSLVVIEQLQKRLAQLEHPAATAPAPAPTPDVNARVETLEHSVSDLASGAAKVPSDFGLPLHGFIDVGYAHGNGKTPAYDHSGFRLGTFDVYLAPQIGERVKGLVELAFEYGRDGVLGTDLERLQLGYVVNDSLTLWGGRFHTPYGYWNTAFHHGAQIQTSITRPRMIAFEDQGGILPSHTVGAWATGKSATELGRVSYDLYVGNADSLRDGTLDYNAVGGDLKPLGSGFNLGLSPKGVPGLTLGAHGVQQKIHSVDAASTVNGQIGLQVLGAYAFFESDRWELIGEYYSFNNQDLRGATGSHHSRAGFVQAAYQLVDRLSGFARVERASLNGSDPYFQLMNNGTTSFGSSYHQSTVGLRYELDPRSALKLQLEHLVDEGNASRSVNWLRAQYSVRF